MSELTDFLRARLDEDEQAARNAIVADRPGTHWEWEAPDDYGDPESPRWLRTVEEFPTTSGVGDLPGFPLGYDCKAAPSSAMAHIARHDPARALREVEAKRQIIEEEIDNLVLFDGEWGCAHGPEQIERGECDDRGALIQSGILRALAAVYSDHPDYREEW